MQPSLQQMMAMYHDLSARVDDLTPRLDAVEETSQQIGPQGVPGPVSGGNEYQGYWSGLESYEALETVTFNKHLYVAKVKIPKPPPPPGLHAIPNFVAVKFFIPSVASVTPIGYYYENGEFAEGLWTKSNEVGNEPVAGTPVQLWQFFLHRENEAEQVRFEPVFFNFNGEPMGETSEAKRETPGGNLWTTIFNDQYNGVVGSFWGFNRQQQKEQVFFDVRWGSAKLTKSFVIAVFGGLREKPAPHKGEYTTEIPQGYGLELKSAHIVEPPEEGNNPPSKDPRWERIV